MKTVTAVVFLSLAFCCNTVTSAVPTYRIETLGFTDIEHTRSDGYKYSQTIKLNQAGQIAGYSWRYNGGSSDIGQSAWSYNGVNTFNIGLTGYEHSRNDGYKYNQTRQLNEAGHVLGFAERYNSGSAELGRSAWLYNGLTTVNVGLIDTEHTRIDGYKYSDGNRLNEAGQVLGSSDRFDVDGADWGLTSWLSDGGITISIGLTSSEHTRDDGYKWSYANQLNETGQVSGASMRYNESTYIGQSAWLYNVTSINIGLIGQEHTRNDGYKWSTSHALNEAGQVLGRSLRYNGGLYEMGQSVWLYDGVTTVDVGLTDIEHTRSDSFRYSGGEPQLNSVGQIIGNANRYNGYSDSGQSAWFYDSMATSNIGLIGSEHTRNDGYKYSYALQLNDVGQVIGSSTRYQGANISTGRSAWFYGSSTTVDIGLTDSEHTRNDGYRFSEPQHLYETGQVIGYSSRYNNGSTYLGDSVWYFNGTATTNLGLTGSEYIRIRV